MKSISSAAELLREASAEDKLAETNGSEDVGKFKRNNNFGVAHGHRLMASKKVKTLDDVVPKPDGSSWQTESEASTLINPKED